MWVKLFDPFVYTLNTLLGLLHFTFWGAGVRLPGHTYLVYRFYYGFTLTG
jgi:hypothetical protein